MVVLTAGEGTSNRAGPCQFGSICLKHQFLAAGYKVIVDGFIPDSLCQPVLGRTRSCRVRIISQHFHEIERILFGAFTKNIQHSLEG